MWLVWHAGVASSISSVVPPLVSGDPFISSDTASDLVALLKATASPPNLCSPPSLPVACLTVGQSISTTLQGTVRFAGCPSAICTTSFGSSAIW